MELNDVQKKSTPHGFSSGEEDVFDFPGVADEPSGSGPVSREAYTALRDAFESVKQRYLTVQAQNAELQIKLKQRDRRTSLGRVYRERDELQNLLQKSYIAYKEKYGENEELQKIIHELKEQLKLSQESSKQGEGGTRTGSNSEEEGKLEHKKYTTIMEEFQIMGLEVVEENEQQFVVLTDRDNLKKWIQEKSGDNIAVVFKDSTLEDKATVREGLTTLHEGCEKTEENRKKLEAEVIHLKNKILDQAEELNRFYKVFKEAMEQNLKFKEERQRAEREKMQKGLPASAPRTISQGRSDLKKKAESMLASVKEQVAEVKQVKEHIEKQNKTLRMLTELSVKCTEDFLQFVGTPHSQDVPDSPRGIAPSSGAEGGTRPPSQGQSRREGDMKQVFSDDAPLSIPVQESEMCRLQNNVANDETSNEAVYNPRLPGRDEVLAPSGTFTRGTVARTLPMATASSETTGTGESDIEVIEEEEDFLGATSSRGKLCPVCERFFPSSYSQMDFEMHVQEHFVDD